MKDMVKGSDGGDAVDESAAMGTRISVVERFEVLGVYLWLCYSSPGRLFLYGVFKYNTINGPEKGRMKLAIQDQERNYCIF